MWFIGRHLTAENPFQARAQAYWERRLAIAKSASDKDPFRKELGIIGVWFLWNVEPSWLMVQLPRLLNAGFAPNDGLGVIDKISEELPTATDQAVEIVRALVRHPEVEPWVFGSQEQSLRKILTEGKFSSSPMTVASVKEIISVLASRGNPAFRI